MPLYNGSQKIKDLYVGSDKIKEAYIWNGSSWNKVYTSIPPLQGASFSSGRVTIPENVWTTIGSSVVVGTGTGGISVNYQWGIDSLQWISFNRQVRLLQNGNVIASNTWTGTTSGWNVTLSKAPMVFNQGDLIQVQAYVSGTGRTSARNVDSMSGSYG